LAPSGGITYANEATLGSNTVADFTDNQKTDLSAALEHGTKVIHFHGTADPAIFWRTSADYYRHVATWLGHGKADFRELQDWSLLSDTGHWPWHRLRPRRTWSRSGQSVPRAGQMG